MTQLASELPAFHSPLVVCADANGARFTLPLGSIVRFLEVSARSLIPHPQNAQKGMYAVQGEEGLLPLVHVSATTVDALPTASVGCAPSTRPVRWPVLTYVHREQEVGIMVDQIVDVVDSPVSSGQALNAASGEALTVVAGHRTAVLSVSTVAAQACLAA